MKEKIELLKSWISTGQVVTQEGRNIDDLMTLVNQIELSSIGVEERTLDPTQLLSDIDHLLSYHEDFTHGKDGEDITLMRHRIYEFQYNNKSKLAVPSKKGEPNTEEDLGKR